MKRSNTSNILLIFILLTITISVSAIGILIYSRQNHNFPYINRKIPQGFIVPIIPPDWIYGLPQSHRILLSKIEEEYLKGSLEKDGLFCISKDKNFVYPPQKLVYYFDYIGIRFAAVCQKKYYIIDHAEIYGTTIIGPFDTPTSTNK